ncbi:MAG TPA: hypothetical protein VKS78_05570 [Roseiarcus sp.]|nr:hypothetical protein [Roseiarcus sp.]
MFGHHAITATNEVSTDARKSDRRRRLAIAAAFAMAFAVGLGAETAAATPADLARDSDVAAFANLIKTYSSATRVRWIVAAPTLAAADVAVANIGLHLASADRPLLQRVSAETFGDNPDIAPGAKSPVGWIAPQTAPPPGGGCSWQVWVADPAAPSAGAAPIYVPLAPNDRMPVGSSATFRVSYTGLLQSKVYAFGETQPGDIRDLSAAPDVNIPVAAGDTETILLAMSRQPAPFLEGIRSALAASAGQRRDLGKQYALNENLLGRGRGIGANIQLLTPNMVLAKGDIGPVAERAPTGSNDAMETCRFQLTPAPEAMR